MAGPGEWKKEAAIAALRKGVDPGAVATGLGLSRQTVAAYQAHLTMGRYDRDGDAIRPAGRPERIPGFPDPPTATELIEAAFRAAGFGGDG